MKMLFCLKLQLDKALRRLLEPEPLLQEGRARAILDTFTGRS